MASLKDAAEQLTDDLERLVGQLKSELQNGEIDFSKLVTISDQLSERADGVAETFSNINDTLMQRIDQLKSGSRSSQQGSRSQSKAGSRS